LSSGIEKLRGTRMVDDQDKGLPTRPGLPKGHGPVLLMRHIEDIRAAIAAGYTGRAIFEQLADHLAGMSFRQFTTYMGRLRNRPEVNTIAALRPPKKGKLASSSPVPAAVIGSAYQPHRDSTPGRNDDGPKAPPRPRGFVRRAGLPDDNKEYLIGLPDPPSSR
jgi:hypothetical protein